MITNGYFIQANFYAIGENNSGGSGHREKQYLISALYGGSKEAILRAILAI
jgi:hypothetical protein